MANTGWEPIDDDWGAEDRDWERLVRQLRNGECTPFIGAGACAGTLPTGPSLSRNIAKDFKYPFQDDTELNQVSQYASIRSFSPVNFKEDVAERLKGFTWPDANRPREAHATLAKFPISTYLTTNYDDFMVRALKAESKDPIYRHYPWYTEPKQGGRRSRAERIRKPTAQRPLVYHLHGSYHQPQSMVISEEDYHVFLSHLSAEHTGEWNLPAPIIGAMTQRPLLFVGYSLHDWTFRVLFRGLIKPMESVLQRGHVSIQLAPELADPRKKTRKRAKEYLERYFGQLNVSVYWGEADKFFDTLGAYMGSSRA
jgi:hypothetical protein